MAKRYWPPAIPSFTAGSVKNCRKNRGCQQRLQIHSWARRWCLRVLLARLTAFCHSAAKAVVLSKTFSHSECENASIYSFFFGLEKETYQSCWCWGSPRLMIPQKASLVFQRTNCYVFMGERCLDWCPKMRFLPWLLTVKVQLFFLPSHSSPV